MQDSIRGNEVSLSVSTNLWKNNHWNLIIKYNTERYNTPNRFRFNHEVTELRRFSSPVISFRHYFSWADVTFVTSAQGVSFGLSIVFGLFGVFRIFRSVHSKTSVRYFGIWDSIALMWDMYVVYTLNVEGCPQCFRFKVGERRNLDQEGSGVIFVVWKITA